MPGSRSNPCVCTGGAATMAATRPRWIDFNLARRRPRHVVSTRAAAPLLLFGALAAKTCASLAIVFAPAPPGLKTSTAPSQAEGRRQLFGGALAAAVSIGVPSTSMASLGTVEDTRAALEKALREDIWFVSGRVRKEFFAPKFRFQDPDVKLEGIEAYGRGVASLFDQDKTTAEILDVTVAPDAPREIRVRWRLAAAVGLPPTLPIRVATAELAPYIVTSVLHLNSDNLVDFQEDVFDTPTSELLKKGKFSLDLRFN